MSSTADDLLLIATAVAERAYAPYSNFHVGAAVLASSGRIYSGANVENASYSITSCAETSAIGAFASAGERFIEAVVVVGPGPEGATPCGRCRQAIREFALNGNIPIYVARPGEILVEHTLEELLPHSFGPENLV